MSEQKQTLDVSWAGIIKVFFAFVVVYLLYQVAEVLVWIVFALVISVLFNQLINFLRKMKIPRVVGVVLVYFSLFGAVSLFAYIIGPSLYREIESFIGLLDEYIKSLSPVLQYAGVD